MKRISVKCPPSTRSCPTCPQWVSSRHSFARPTEWHSTPCRREGIRVWHIVCPTSVGRHSGDSRLLAVTTPCTKYASSIVRWWLGVRLKCSINICRTQKMCLLWRIISILFNISSELIVVEEDTVLLAVKDISLSSCIRRCGSSVVRTFSTRCRFCRSTSSDDSCFRVVGCLFSWSTRFCSAIFAMYERGDRRCGETFWCLLGPVGTFRRLKNKIKHT